MTASHRMINNLIIFVISIQQTKENLMKKYFIIFLLIFLTASSAYSKGFAVDKGAYWYTGLASFSSQSGNLSEDANSNSMISIIISQGLEYFIIPNFYIGGNLAFSSQSQGNNEITSVGVGPSIGFAIGSASSINFPYFRLSYLYQSATLNKTEATGSDLNVGIGITIQSGDHLGFMLEGSYHTVTMKAPNDIRDGNILSIGIGITGLFYK
jgi:hypothetical protein